MESIFDGTLAHYDEWQGIEHIGAPIAPMVDRVKQWLAEGKDVRIFTARIAGHDAFAVIHYIEKWCQEHIGRVLQVTNRKDYGMIALYDDRCVQVITNTGELVEEQLPYTFSKEV